MLNPTQRLEIGILVIQGKTQYNWQFTKVTVADPECLSSLHQVCVLCWILLKKIPDTLMAYSFDSYI